MCRLRVTRAVMTSAALLVAPGMAGVVRAQQDPAERAARVEQQMTDEERFSLIISVMGTNSLIPEKHPLIPDGVPMSAGYTPGVPRLGVPALLASDASMGITNPGYRPDDPGATALPASILVGASFNPALARQGGELLGREARSRGFNIMLAGGMNLARDVRNGRNFEYYSEDPWASALFAAEAVKGIQSQKVISTLKHFSLNNNEVNRHWLDAIIDPAAHRESDLLAFQIAVERSRPGAIMSGYNKVNGEYASGNRHLLTEVLKGAWGYPGWVMSDWGAVLDWRYALNGLDQESGIQADIKLWGAEAFTDSLRAALASGEFPRERLSDMVRRILYSIYAVGVDQWEAPGPVAADQWGASRALDADQGEARPQLVDSAAHHLVALETARQGIVLLKNDGILPLSGARPLRIAVIGGWAHLGVPTGTGSGAVRPMAGYAATVPIGGVGNLSGARNVYLLPSSFVEEIGKLLPDARIEYDPGYTPAEAALTAKRADLVIAFGIRVEGEGFDLADLSLPWGQDAVIEAVAATNPNTLVVLETGNPVSMPWRDDVRAIVEAWYPGQAGGQAIAEVLTGRVNPSGRLPITFPADLADTPRPQLPGLGTAWGTPTTIRYDEGAEVGYRWYAKTGRKPLFPFGFGLSYTTFAYDDFDASVSGDTTVTASFTVRNTGDRAGADVPQLYLTSAAGQPRVRLLGFEKVVLAPGESRRVTLTADPRLLASFDGPAGVGEWEVAGGAYEVALGSSAETLVARKMVELRPRRFGH